MTRTVMDAELDAVPVPCRSRSPVPPLQAFRSYHAIVAALSRATSDSGYVVAHARADGRGRVVSPTTPRDAQGLRRGQSA